MNNNTESASCSTPFAELGLEPSLLKGIEAVGFTEPSPIQAAVIPGLVEGEDIIAQAQTGTGKTAAFALPFLQRIDPSVRTLQALILTPTRELALQVAEAFRDLGRFKSVRTATVYGGQAMGPQIADLRRGAAVVVGTPGRVLDFVNRGIIKLDALQMLALDEADQMLSMGFIEDLEQILRGANPDRVSALFSATLPQQIQRLAKDYLRNPRMVRVEAKELTATSVDQRYAVVPARSRGVALCRILETEKINRAIVFCHTRILTTEVAAGLNARGVDAAAINGDLSQSQREAVLERFKAGQVRCLVATDVAARGIHVDNVSHVINFDVPRDPEDYLHRIGRTGRGGEQGVAISMFAPHEERKLRNIERYTRHEATRMTIPTADELDTHRDIAWGARLTERLGADRDNSPKGDMAIVTQLLAEGHTPEEIAVQALGLARAAERDQTDRCEDARNLDRYTVDGSAPRQQRRGPPPRHRNGPRPGGRPQQRRPGGPGGSGPRRSSGPRPGGGHGAPRARQ